MGTTLSIISLIGLFLILGLSADQVAKNLRIIAAKLGLPIFLFGLLLGLLTSFPEIAIAVNAVNNGIQGLSVGNLIGGMIALLSLIMGISVVLHGEVKNDGRLSFLAISFAYIITPLILATDGQLDFKDGLVLIILYFVIMAYLYYTNRDSSGIKVSIVVESKVIKELMIALIGIALVVVASHYIIIITQDLLTQYNLSPFVIGLIFFPIGTNLPELTVAVASWRRRDKELSFSNLLGSAITNVMMIGILVAVAPYAVKHVYSYTIAFITLAVVLTLLFIFYRTGKRLAHWEGWILIAVYLIFLAFQLIYPFLGV